MMKERLGILQQDLSHVHCSRNHANEAEQGALCSYFSTTTDDDDDDDDDEGGSKTQGGISVTSFSLHQRIHS